MYNTVIGFNKSYINQTFKAKTNKQENIRRLKYMIIKDPSLYTIYMIILQYFIQTAHCSNLSSSGTNSSDTSNDALNLNNIYHDMNLILRLINLNSIMESNHEIMNQYSNLLTRIDSILDNSDVAANSNISDGCDSVAPMPTHMNNNSDTQSCDSECSSSDSSDLECKAADGSTVYMFKRNECKCYVRGQPNDIELITNMLHNSENNKMQIKCSIDVNACNFTHMKLILLKKEKCLLESVYLGHKSFSASSSLSIINILIKYDIKDEHKFEIYKDGNNIYRMKCFFNYKLPTEEELNQIRRFINSQDTKVLQFTLKVPSFLTRNPFTFT